MGHQLFDKRKTVLNLLLAVALSISVGCNSTKYVGEHEYLLRRNKVVLKTDKPIPNKGELKDNLTKYVIQKPNTNSYDILPFRLPLKLWRYNRRYAKLHDRPDSLLPKSVERPAILDTSLIQRSMLNMKSYLFWQGYFYAKITDTFTVSHKKAYVTYNIDLGKNYTINNIYYNIEDSNIAHIVMADAELSSLQKGKDFSFSLLEEERSRLTSLIRNNGYYRFTQENINYLKTIDTIDKAQFKNAESAFESAVNFITARQPNKKSTVDITINIQLADDTLAYKRYIINSVNVYPDYKTLADLKDSTMIRKTINRTDFKYHSDYVHAKVLYEHIYLTPGNLYAEKDFNKTYSKLNELGIFQYIRVQPHENRKNRGILDYDILLNRSKRFDFLRDAEA